MQTAQGSEMRSETEANSQHGLIGRIFWGDDGSYKYAAVVNLAGRLEPPDPTHRMTVAVHERIPPKVSLKRERPT